jgi:hypothetical protein
MRRHYPSLDRKAAVLKKNPVETSSTRHPTIEQAEQATRENKSTYSKLLESGPRSEFTTYVTSPVQEPTDKLWSSNTSGTCKDDGADDGCTTLHLVGPIDEIREQLSDDVGTEVDKPVEAVENELTALIVQKSFASSMVLENLLSILRSKNEFQRAESRNIESEVAISPPATFVDAGRSDWGSWERLLKLFHCAAEASFECNDENLEKGIIVGQDEEDNDNQALKISSLRKFCISHDRIDENKEWQATTETTFRHDRGTNVSIFSALSNRSRRGRRSFRTKSRSINQEVDSMIEIAVSHPERKIESSEGSNHKKIPSDIQSHQYLLNHSEKNEIVEEDDADFVPCTALKRAFNSITMVPSTGHISPIIIHDQQTMLPDNLPPMARLRYFSHIGGKCGLLVTQERCYV